MIFTTAGIVVFNNNKKKTNLRCMLGQLTYHFSRKYRSWKSLKLMLQIVRTLPLRYP